jgi:SAM-dependent methyltransferase
VEVNEYAVMREAEDHHGWYRGMTAITRAVLDRRVGRGRDLRILDAGCGTGAVMAWLADYGSVTGVDYAAEALQLAGGRGLRPLLRGSVLHLPFAPACFDLITSFDVMSSCGDGPDRLALAEFARLLRPGGWLLLRLPAYRWLRGRHDTVVHTRHRYSRSELRGKLRKAAFAPLLLSYANCLLFPLAAAKRLGEHLVKTRQQGSDLTLPVGPLNGVLGRVLAAEAPLVRGIGLPFGLTLVALARKA